MCGRCAGVCVSVCVGVFVMLFVVDSHMSSFSSDMIRAVIKSKCQALLRRTTQIKASVRVCARVRALRSNEIVAGFAHTLSLFCDLPVTTSTG